MPRVLLAEDDGVIARAMMAHLRRAGMDVEWAEDGDRALKKIRFERPDVAVIDLMLPGEDGWRMRHASRRRGAVVEEPLRDFLARHRMAGVMVVRPADGGGDEAR